jgi:hypothetical protein
MIEMNQSVAYSVATCIPNCYASSLISSEKNCHKFLSKKYLDALSEWSITSSKTSKNRMKTADPKKAIPNNASKCFRPKGSYDPYRDSIDVEYEAKRIMLFYEL